MNVAKSLFAGVRAVWIKIDPSLTSRIQCQLPLFYDLKTISSTPGLTLAFMFRSQFSTNFENTQLKSFDSNAVSVKIFSFRPLCLSLRS